MKLLIPTLLLAVNFCFSQSPGNVGTLNLSAWFKADVLPLGNVISWSTSFANAAGTITLSDASAPYPQATNTPAELASNYNLTVDFSGNSSATNLLALTNPTNFDLLDNGTSSANEGSFFCSYHLPVSSSCVGCHALVYRESTALVGDGIEFRTRLGTNCRIAISSGASINATRNWSQLFNRDIAHYRGNRSSATSLIVASRDRNALSASPSGSSGFIGLHIGARRTGTTSFQNTAFDGYINEVIFFDRTLSADEANRVNTYLAVKYGTTLDNTGGGIQGDYTASNGANVWNADLSPTYHNDVIGLARDDDEVLLQKQSHTFDDVTRIYLSTLATWNGSNTGTIGSNFSYLMVGDNQGAVCATSYPSTEMPAGCGLFSRIEREWKVTRTNFSEDFHTDITLSPCAVLGSVAVADLRFLVDDDGDFSNGGTTCYFNGDGSGIAISYTNPEVTVSNISTAMIPNNTTRYTTIASIQQVTPLPVELSNFIAKRINGNEVNVSWNTLSEKSSDYFTIQRSIDNKQWEDITNITALGNSTETTNYTYVDRNSLDGFSYYRLKQFDLNGEAHISSVRTVQGRHNNERLTIYPNPTSGQIRVEGKVSELSNLHIYTPLGEVVTNRVEQLEKKDTSVLLDLSNLKQGIYIIQTKTQRHKVIKK